jgi:hypothetical protein
MKKVVKLCFFAVMLSITWALPAETASEAGAGKEVRNLVSAVKSASPGDYILLPSGKKYILTKEEIAIVRGEFDYEDLSGVKTETLNDGTEIKTISAAHTAYVYPDGQTTHLVKTGVSFTAYMRQHIEPKYLIGRYIDYSGDAHDYRTIDPPEFEVFRASIQFQTISNGIDESEVITVTAYNYYGRNYMQRYYPGPDWIWGNVRGSYTPVGESHSIDFDVE